MDTFAIDLEYQHTIDQRCEELEDRIDELKNAMAGMPNVMGTPDWYTLQALKAELRDLYTKV